MPGEQQKPAGGRGGAVDKTYGSVNMHVMQAKLTLRMEAAVIRKAKRLARKRGKSVSRMLSDFIALAEEPREEASLPPLTAAMVGVLAAGDGVVNEDAYRQHLEDRHL